MINRRNDDLAGVEAGSEGALGRGSKGCLVGGLVLREWGGSIGEGYGPRPFEA